MQVVARTGIAGPELDEVCKFFVFNLFPFSVVLAIIFRVSQQQQGNDLVTMLAGRC